MRLRNGSGTLMLLTIGILGKNWDYDLGGWRIKTVHAITKKLHYDYSTTTGDNDYTTIPEDYEYGTTTGL